MKRFYSLVFYLFTCLAITAQNDTLLFENFQAEEDPTADWPLFPNGDDITWVRYDEDQQPVNGGDPVEQNWFWSEIFNPGIYPEDYPDSPIVALLSFSYMADLNAQNRNWLITPPLSIFDDQAVLSWKSTPFQLPRYMDGYKVLVSTTGNNIEDFTDTLFVAAEMTAILSASGNTLDLDSFSFSSGYFHADMLTDTNYFKVDADSFLARGILEPHSVSLASYAGQKIYIAFLHDSFDDFYFALDDILVTGSATSDAQTVETLNHRFYTFPNPAELQLNVLYRLPEAAEVSLQLTDSQGKALKSCFIKERQGAGEQQFPILVNDLPKGNYFITLTIDGNHFTKSFFKR